MKQYIIYDGNYELEQLSENEKEDEDICLCVCNNFDELREETIELLQNYYEIYSEYGDPIESLIRYIPEDKFIDLLEEYNYTLKIKEV